ncbi:hypothetical protein I4U23_027155 [Adineta vaga]|nr:hypothetical protein I4U23_027155 [Adineta vaga]
MKLIINFNVCFFTLFLIYGTKAIPYNQPKLCSNASWDINATTFAWNNTVAVYPYSVFVNRDNTVVSVSRNKSVILVWFDGSSSPLVTNSTVLDDNWSVFVTDDNEIYFDTKYSSKNSTNNFTIYQIEKWTLNGTKLSSNLTVTSQCGGLFIDLNNTIYCSLYSLHTIVSKSLNNSGSNFDTVAGNGTAGGTSIQLNRPSGMFVTTNFELYVADYGNSRIQKFQLGNLLGTTVPINVSTGNSSLKNPSGVVMDADGYLFILDSGNNRIVAESVNGFRCVAGCSQVKGSEANQFKEAWALSFDNLGNIFVMDTKNSRIQKVLLASNSCDQPTSTHLPTTTQLLTSTELPTTTQSPTSTQLLTSTQLPTSTLLLTSTELLATTQPLTTTESTTSITSTLPSTAIETTGQSTTEQAASTVDESILTTQIKSDASTDHLYQLTSESLSTLISSSQLILTSSTSTTVISTTQTSISNYKETSTINQINTSLLYLTSRQSTIMMNVNSSQDSFITLTCANQEQAGPFCNISIQVCDMINPCLNNGQCINDNQSLEGYFCQCSNGFDGLLCENDHHICKSNLCWNNGQCNETSNNTFECLCISGWNGIYCELKLNLCENITCEHGGICRSLFLNYTCECLSDSYSGRHCETISQKQIIIEIAAKSMTFVAIVTIIIAIMFFVLMDILKYVFSIDVTKNESNEGKEKTKTIRKSKQRPQTIIRFQYVDHTTSEFT